MLPMESPETRPPANNFEQYFEVVPALTPALKNEVFRVRHQVFCEDLAFEAQTLDRRERDHYDDQSLHLLIRNVRTGEFVGCTRIIRVRPQDTQPRLPFELICGGSIDRSIVDPAALPRHSIAEISRLSIVSKYRQRKGEQNSPAPISTGDFGTPNQPRFPYILVGLYMGTVELARLHDIETLFVLTEPRLAQHLHKLGLEIQTIGAPIEYHGTRIPSMMKTSTVREQLQSIFCPLYDLIAKEIGATVTNTH
ncbi:MAG: PEP-CTERM/exosortase system-associated acyltransferase [Betaproteobacteria bacterium]